MTTPDVSTLPPVDPTRVTPQHRLDLSFSWDEVMMNILFPRKGHYMLLPPADPAKVRSG
jgi:hypothetical protein